MVTDKNTALQVEIGQRIGKCRFRKDESQEELAKAVNVTREVIQHWERGSRHIKADHLYKLAKHFDVSADWLLGLDTPLSGNPVKRAAEKYTMLSLTALSRIREAVLTITLLGGNVETANTFFVSEYFYELINAMEKYRIYANISKGQPNYITFESVQEDVNYIMKQAAKLEMMEVVSRITQDIDKEGGESNGKH